MAAEWEHGFPRTAEWLADAARVRHMLDRRSMTRANDHGTSVAAASAVEPTTRTCRSMLRRAFIDAGKAGLTDEEAARRAGLLHTCYWKRCGELRADAVIAWTGFERKGAAGVNRKVSAIVVLDPGPVGSMIRGW